MLLDRPDEALDQALSEHVMALHSGAGCTPLHAPHGAAVHEPRCVHALPLLLLTVRAAARSCCPPTKRASYIHVGKGPTRL